MCHGNHSNFFNTYPASVSVEVVASTDTAQDDVPFDLTEVASGFTSADWTNRYFSLSQIVISAVSGNSGDQFSIDLSETQLTRTGNTIYYSGTAFATLSGGVDGAPLVISPIPNTGGTTNTGYGQAYFYQFMSLIDNVRYTNDSDAAPYSRVVNILVDFADATDRSFNVTVNVENGASLPELNLFSADYETLQAQGVEQRVNTYTSSTQYEASVVTLADGTSIVTWMSQGQDGSGTGIYAQRLDSGGAPVGSEFRVNTTTADNDYFPHVAGLDDGGFVIAWMHIGSPSQHYAQRYNADGNAVGGEIAVGSTYNSQSSASVISLSGGGFAIGWVGQGSGNDAVFVQRYDATGATVGLPITVASTAQNDDMMEMSALGDGFVVVHRARDSVTNLYSIAITRYDENGVQVGSTMQVGQSGNNVYYPVVEQFSGGDFVVAWQDYDSLAGRWDIFAQLFHSGGTSAGDPFRITGFASGDEEFVSITALTNGGFAAVWESRAGNDGEVFVRTFGADGTPTSGDIRVHQASTGYQEAVRQGDAVTQLDDGSLLVVWHSGGEIYSRIITDEELSLSNTPQATVEIPLQLTWHDSQDGSETLTVTITGHPDGATFNVGEAHDPETWVIEVGDPAALTGLVMTPPVNYSGTFTISVEATTFEAATSTSATSTLSFEVVVDDVNLAPVLSDPASAIATYVEDGTVAQLLQGVVLSDGDLPANFSGGGIVLNVSGTGGGINLRAGSDFHVNSNGDGTFSLAIQVGPTQIGVGTISGIGTTTATITLDGGATLERINDLIDDFTFYVPGEILAEEDRTVTLTFDDGGNNGSGGGLTGVVTQTLHIQPTDDAAVAVGDGFATDEATAISGSVFGNDSDVDGPSLQIASVNGSAASVGQEITLTSGALLTLNADGTFDYDPNGAFDELTPAGSGSSNAAGSDSFTYTLLNGTTATVSVAIAGVGSSGDVIEGGGGPDNVVGTSANDRIQGGDGDDVLVGGSGRDWLDGGEGNDIHYVDDPNDVVIERDEEGYDTVFTTSSFALGGSAAVEALSAADNSSADAINLTGNGFSNRLFGNAGTNVLNGGGGADILIGFAGDDIYHVDGVSDVLVEAAGNGHDAVFSTADFALGAGTSVEVISAAQQQVATPLTLIGNEIDNWVFGNAGANQLNGGTGSDTLMGYGGDDIYVVDNTSDVVIEHTGEGRDTIFATNDYSIAAYSHVEVLSAAEQISTSAMNLTGNGLDNVIFGNDGANRLDGGYGNDVLIGFGGEDVFRLSGALNGLGNVDYIIGFNTADDIVELDESVFSALGLGVLDSRAFVTGNAAITTEHRIIYDSATGALFYDGDGAGGEEAVRIATFDPNHEVVLATNFVVA